MVAQGLAQLKYSLKKYANWGATKKVRQLNEFVELVKQIDTVGRKNEVKQLAEILCPHLNLPQKGVIIL